MDKTLKHKNRFEKNSKKTIALFLLLSTVFILFSVEAILKLTNPLPQNPERPPEFLSQFSKPYGLERSIRLREWNPNTARRIRKNQSYINKTDTLKIPPSGGWIFRVDKDGYIMPSRIHPNPDLTLIFLGGSSTECLCVDENNRFPYLTGRIIEKTLKKNVNSYNSGVSGNNSLHSINILLNKGTSLKPNFAVMMHVVNDFATLIYTDTYWNDLDTRKPIIKNNFCFEKSPSFGSVLRDLNQLIFPQIFDRIGLLKSSVSASQKPLDEWRHYRGKKINLEKDHLDTLLKMYEKNMRIFIDICRDMDITPVLMTQANRFTEKPSPFVLKSLKKLHDENGVTYSRWKHAYDCFNNKLRELGENQDVMIIELAREIPQTREFLYDTIHLNDKGSKLAAEIISSKLIEYLRN